MAPKRTLGRHSFFDAPALLAFLDDGLGPGKRDTAERHRRTIQAAAVAAADRGSKTLDLSVAAVPNLPAFARERLPEAFALLTSSVDSVATSGDLTTTKFVVKLQDGHRVESVLMRHDGGRNTLCVSSQVGCKMGCTFCATGTLGELGNLTAGEILEQLAHARELSIQGWRQMAAQERQFESQLRQERSSADRKLREVCAAIAEEAFVASPYPVGVSLEMHCSVPQQKRLAVFFRRQIERVVHLPRGVGFGNIQRGEIVKPAFNINSWEVVFIF